MDTQPTTLSIQGYEINYDGVTADVEQILSIEAQYWHPTTKDNLLKLAEALIKSHKSVDFADIDIFIEGKNYLWETNNAGIFPVEQEAV